LGSSINNTPFFSSWLQDVICLSFPHLKLGSIFLLKNNHNTTKWKDDPVFHTDIPPGWIGNTSGIDERHDAPMVLWFPLERAVALDYNNKLQYTYS
jgi:hypothetical protein